MEVGKLIMNVVHSKAHMTLSVKPFGCMPSAGVSDGVQSAIAEKFPGTIFCPVETSGDGRVNFYSRVQMYLFKAKMAAQTELTRVYNENGMTREQLQAFLTANPTYGNALHKSPHSHNGTAADLVAEVSPIIGMSRFQRAVTKVKSLTKLTTTRRQKIAAHGDSPHGQRGQTSPEHDRPRQRGRHALPRDARRQKSESQARRDDGRGRRRVSRNLRRVGASPEREQSEIER